MIPIIMLVPIMIRPKLQRIKNIQQMYDPNDPLLRPSGLNSPSISNQTERKALKALDSVYFSTIGCAESVSMKLKQFANAVMMMKRIKRNILKLYHLEMLIIYIF